LAFMRILIVNPPHPANGSRIPDDHLPPLGLLSIGGPLLDDGHDVKLLDAEFGPMSLKGITSAIIAHDPDLLLLGHSGSTSAHPRASETSIRTKAALPRRRFLYGAVFPPYNWRDILADQPEFAFIARGEGEQTCRDLVAALACNAPLRDVDGIAFHD